MVVENSVDSTLTNTTTSKRDDVGCSSNLAIVVMHLWDLIVVEARSSNLVIIVACSKVHIYKNVCFWRMNLDIVFLEHLGT
jgi:hypothetical protein